MNARVRQLARFARVRTIQHNLAAAAAAEAQRQVESLEASIGKLVGLRDGMRAPGGVIPAAMLASTGEIMTRLDQARETVARSAAGARAQASLREATRLAARRNQESAERLTDKAARTAEAIAERKRPLGRGVRRQHSEQE